MQTQAIVVRTFALLASLASGVLVGCGGSQPPSSTPASTSGTSEAAPTPKEATAELGASSTGAEHPILDTHIHLYQVTKAGGVPWPPPKAKNLYRDILPAEYKNIAQQHNIVGTGIVEANPTLEEDQRILALTKEDPFFKFFVGSLEIGSATFSGDLDKLAVDPRFVGIRGFLWSPKLSLDAKQLASLKELEKRGMTLDIISRGDLNPKDKVDALASAVPGLYVIIDHLGGAKGESPDPKWVSAMQKLATHPHIYVKFSSFFDMYNPAASEDDPWQSPSELSAYKPHFDVLMKAFGEDRLVWGSNWPVVEQGGGIAKEIAIAEDYLKAYGPEVRDKVMFKNAQAFYKRHH
jgi:L-fuconolactonase